MGRFPLKKEQDTKNNTNVVYIDIWKIFNEKLSFSL
jgi:hypothetical protein